jgi:hypothetical protein
VIENHTSIPKRLKTLAIGRTLGPNERYVFHRLSLIAFLACVNMGVAGVHRQH